MSATVLRAKLAQPAERRPAKPAVDWRLRGPQKLVMAALVSGIVHFSLLLALALVLIPPRSDKRGVVILASLTAPRPEKVALLHVTPPKSPPRDHSADEMPSVALLASKFVAARPTGAARTGVDLTKPRTDLAPHPAETSEWLTKIAGSPFGMLDGRDSELKAALLADGGTRESEEAVERGLRWLAAHQRADGSWHYNHSYGGGCEECSKPGNHGSTTAATGMALLPFLGAGYTHRRGPYTETVRKGLDFLKSKVIETPFGGDLQGGTNLYAQAIATLALCEAYAMTEDRSLDPVCRQAIAFIVHAQDPNGGGWRYTPGQAGDTSVTGWMWPALKSGQMNYLPVPASTFKKAWQFLDTMQDDSGAAYGYLGPSKQEPTMTAVGLLCRMYGGWPRRHPSLARGVQTLSRKGPSPTDLYYNYYAAQVLRHWGGAEWISWNERLREQLIRTQATAGHEAGSWYFRDKHGDQGGRLYNTAMALLTLEVYYRYLPIYGTGAVDEQFKN